MAAQRLGEAARAAGLVAPAFRSPPRDAGAVRTIRRFSDGAVVAVRTSSRPFDRVVADMVEGVLAANALEEEAAQRLRLALLAVAGTDDTRGDVAAASLAEARVAERQTQAA